eukprot:CAMPEP_0115883912 /NCGR_PEP_ID=MMETSP0287-20121206/29831_1 /TAXON_ID=412157 /ORGANISM="Chrysochromulina rotalis, Strain UIO044" /LENGTH=70 /DNA_ID=CAMNT_0003340169 /DNA_START=1 /DNA_END=211 /DNA_ORIENTATION=-
MRARAGRRLRPLIVGVRGQGVRGQGVRGQGATDVPETWGVTAGLLQAKKVRMRGLIVNGASSHEWDAPEA